MQRPSVMKLLFLLASIGFLHDGFGVAADHYPGHPKEIKCNLTAKTEAPPSPSPVDQVLETTESLTSEAPKQEGTSPHYLQKTTVEYVVETTSGQEGTKPYKPATTKPYKPATSGQPPEPSPTIAEQPVEEEETSGAPNLEETTIEYKAEETTVAYKPAETTEYKPAETTEYKPAETTEYKPAETTEYKPAETTEYKLEETSTAELEQETTVEYIVPKEEEQTTELVPEQEVSTVEELETTEAEQEETTPEGLAVETTPEEPYPTVAEGPNDKTEATASEPVESTQEPITFPPIDTPCSQVDSGFFLDKNGSLNWLFCSCAGLIARQLICAQSNAKVDGGRKRRHAGGPQFNCSGLDDGLYPSGACKGVFYSCKYGISSEIDCPYNTVFDEKSKSCKQRKDVAACSKEEYVNKTEPIPAGLEVEGEATAAPTKKLPIDCGKKKTGLHPDPSNKCSSTFYSCFHGAGEEMQCAGGLKFDAEKEACGYPNEIYACTGKKNPPTTAAPKPKPNPESLISTEYKCTKDGSFASPSAKCSHYYFRCVAGSAYKIICPGELYYDAEKDQCGSWANVFACSGKRPTSPKPTTTAPAPTTPKLPINCLSLPNGDHPDPAKKCSSVYYSCFNGFGAARACPAGTFFDSKSGECDFSQYVPACGGKPRPPTQPPVKTSPVPKLPFDCGKRYDGGYPSGKCASQYWVCVTGTTLKANCPNGTVYDSEVDQCGYKEQIPACGGVRPTYLPNPSR